MRGLIVVLALASPAFGQSSSLPAGAGCAGEIARYRAVQQNDYTSGNVAKSVYLQMQRETAAAEKACQAGQDAKASALVRASEARHGYSTHL